MVKIGCVFYTDNSKYDKLFEHFNDETKEFFKTNFETDFFHRRFEL